MVAPNGSLSLDAVQLRGTSSRQRAVTSRSPAGIMLINPDRSAYAGLLGRPSRRIHGSLTVYVSLGRAFRVSIDECSWEPAELAIAPPYVPHRISSEDRQIGVLQLESETLDPGRLPPFLSAHGAIVRADLLDRIREAFARLRGADPGLDPLTVDIDELFFGAAIERRRLDPRIALVAERIRERPCTPVDAHAWADLAGLSCSRFLHLFRAEIGTTFRRFRAWKRARSLLPHVSRQPNLSDFALELGYPDATHFSHSIRNFFGLTPKDIFMGSRRLAVVAQRGPPHSLLDGVLRPKENQTFVWDRPRLLEC